MRVVVVSRKGAPVSRDSRPEVWGAIVARMAASRWLAPIGALTLAVAGTLCLTVGQDLANGVDWIWVGIGVTLALAAGLVQLVRELGARRDLDRASLEAERLRVAMKDALQPVAELIADLPGKTPGARTKGLEALAQQAVSALTLLLKDVDWLRAVVYHLDPAGMSCLAYHGRGDTPTPFLRATERGRLACQMVAEGTSHFERDITLAQDEAYRGTGHGYRTYIAAAICTGTTGYGMVTVDAQTPTTSLTPIDRSFALSRICWRSGSQSLMPSESRSSALTGTIWLG